MGEEWIQNADELSFCWIMLSALFQSGASCCVPPASDVNKNLKPHLTDGGFCWAIRAERAV